MGNLNRIILLLLIIVPLNSVVKANTETSNINSDTILLNYGWRWLSFPRMERFGNLPFSSESVLDNLNVYPAKEFTLYAALNSQNSKKWELLPTPHWAGFNLEEVQSTSGYKLYIGQSSGLQPEIKLHGARLHPATVITLPGGGQKQDIGYFIEESQYPWDAFPADLYNTKLTLIQAQYWTMVKDEAKGWKLTGKITPIKYGDMVIVKTNSSTPIQFSWNDPGESEENVEIPEPQNYTWEEKADYTPFFIETDSVSDISEIAVMVDGVCFGATVRQPGDTLVEVDGYFEGLPIGAVVEFETWNGYKSSPVEKDGYIVHNPFTAKKEKRNIYIGETQEYYDVSFKQGELYEIPGDVSHITCQPNPFTNETTITMRLNSAQHIWVGVYDINGAKVKTLLDGDLPGGYYEVKWNGDNGVGKKVSKGVYFYTIRTGSGTEISQKIVLIK